MAKRPWHAELVWLLARAVFFVILVFLAYPDGFRFLNAMRNRSVDEPAPTKGLGERAKPVRPGGAVR